MLVAIAIAGTLLGLLQLFVTSILLCYCWVQCIPIPNDSHKPEVF